VYRPLTRGAANPSPQQILTIGSEFRLSHVYVCQPGFSALPNGNGNIKQNLDSDLTDTFSARA
jgi:hypothetical protein